MRFLVITIFGVFSIQTLLCSGINGNENSTEDLSRIRFNDTDRYNGTDLDEATRAVTERRRVEETEDAKEDEVSDEAEEEDDKFVSTASDISLEHIDFVMLRLSHIAKKTTSNITELRLLQEKEFKVNEVYKRGWEEALEQFNSSKRDELLDKFSNDSIVATVPDEYHIALIAYSLQFPVPALYSDFNKKTREVCSGKDIDSYHYKTYFKFLLLAIETLGRAEMRFRSSNRFLYRGVGSAFSLEVGQIMAFQHFVSTSTHLKVAENFSGKTLFEVQGKYDTAISIKDHSQYEGEEEVLFSPFQVYEVESKHEGKYYTRYVLISHKLPNSGPCLNDKSSNNELFKSTTDSNLQTGAVTSGASSLMNFIVGITIIIEISKFLQI